MGQAWKMLVFTFLRWFSVIDFWDLVRDDSCDHKCLLIWTSKAKPMEQHVDDGAPLQYLLNSVITQPYPFCNHCTSKNSFVKFLADYSTMKGNEVWMHPTTWISHTLCERNRITKNSIHGPIHRNYQEYANLCAESRWEVSRSWRRRE